MAVSNPVDEPAHGEGKGRVGWGRMLFFATLAVVLVFFWWLLIHSGGISGSHG